MRVDSTAYQTPSPSASTILKSGKTFRSPILQSTELRSHPMRSPITFASACLITWYLAGSSTWRLSQRLQVEGKCIASAPADDQWKNSPPEYHGEQHHDCT